MAKIKRGKIGIKEIELGNLKIKFNNLFKRKKRIDSQREDEELHRVQSGKVQKLKADSKAEIKNKFKKLMRNLDNFSDFLEELKENGVIVDKNAQS